MISSENTNARLVRQAFEAIQAGDISSFWSTQADDVTASVSGGGDLAGTFKGKGDADWIPCQIFDKLSRQCQSDPTKPVPSKKSRITDILAGDDHAVLVYEVDVTSSDRPMSGAVVCRISDGKLTHVEHFDPVIFNGGLKSLLP